MNRRIINYCIAGLVISALTFSCSQSDPKSAKSTEHPFAAELNSNIPMWLDEFIVPGAAIAVIDSGEVILQSGFGYADVEQQIEVNEKTGFNIASISKTVSAWGVMNLVEEGKLHLDSPASAYMTRWQLPESEFDPNGVTIRRLLSHTAGLSLHGYPGYSPEDTLPSVEESLSGATNGAGDVRLIMEPGTRWKYSGGGYTMLQLIVEEVTGSSFADYMQSEVLDPLGMTNSSFTIDEKIMAASSKEHDALGDEIAFELFTAQAAAGLHTNIEDMTKFALATINAPGSQDVLEESTIELMTKSAPASERYGLGYGVNEITDPVASGTTLVGHGGANDGWRAILSVDREAGNAFVMITNGASGNYVYERAECAWADWTLGVSFGDQCTNKPMTALLINKIKNEGIEEAIAAFHEAKEDETYYYHEGPMNFLGYQLMWADMTNEALAIFELNVAEFPYAFNVYDSYGEILLELGEEEKAIENYKRSIELNPWNDNGLGVLKKMDIDTDDLGVKVPVEHLQKLVGEYLLDGTDGDWTIFFALEDGVLVGNDDGYQYRIVPLGDDRFVNPHDGKLLEFDATDQSAITLLLFEEHHFNKVN